MPEPIEDFDSIFAEASAADGGDSTETDNDTDVGDGSSDDTDVSDDDGSGDSNEDEPDESDDESDGSASSVSDFDWTSHKDELVEVKIGGVPTKVPLGEALNGYLRQEDYTRKTQAVAEERQYATWAKNLKQALETDPANVVKTLAEAYGVGLDADDDDFESDDPQYAKLKQTTAATQAELRRLQEFQATVEQDRIMAQVKAEIADVQARYPDFDPQEILPIALERGLMVEDAYIWYKGFQASNASKAQAEAERKATERAALEAKKRANSKKVSKSSGFSASPAEVDPNDLDFGDLFVSELNKSKTH